MKILSTNEKELIKTSGIWQGGNDWRSPLPWLPQLAHRATCYPSTPASTPRYTQYTPVHPITPATHQHSVTNNAEVGCGKKTETRATDAAMPINGGATRAGTSGDPLITRDRGNWHICNSNLFCSVFYTQVSFIEDHLFWMTRKQHFGCTPKQKGSQHNTLVGLTSIVSIAPRCKWT